VDDSGARSDTPVVRHARGMAGVRVIRDDGGAAAARFGAATSGDATRASLGGASGIGICWMTTGARSVSLVPGAAAYTRFAVSAGGSASVSWTTSSTQVQFTLVRTK